MHDLELAQKLSFYYNGQFSWTELPHLRLDQINLIYTLIHFDRLNILILGGLVSCVRNHLVRDNQVNLCPR